MNIHPAKVATSLLMASIILSTGCATTQRITSPPASHPITLSGWNGIDEAEFLKPFMLADYRHLQAVRLGAADTKLPPQDDNTYEPTVAVLASAEELILNELRQELRTYLGVSNQLSSEPTLVLNYTISEIDPGSRAARYWVGFGAGSAWVRINGELIDGSSGAVLFKFDQRRIATAGAFGGDYKQMLNSCIREIGGDIGRAISAF